MAREPKKAGLPAAEPWNPNIYEDADVGAVKALSTGTASPEQQQRALKWIIERCCGTYDQSFRPGGPEGARATDFAEGKRWVGNKIIYMIKINLNKKDQG